MDNKIEKNLLSDKSGSSTQNGHNRVKLTCPQTNLKDAMQQSDQICQPMKAIASEHKVIQKSCESMQRFIESSENFRNHQECNGSYGISYSGR